MTFGVTVELTVPRVLREPGGSGAATDPIETECTLVDHIPPLPMESTGTT